MIARDHRSRNNFETGDFGRQYRPRCTSTPPTANDAGRHLPLAFLSRPMFYQDGHNGLALNLAHLFDELRNSSPGATLHLHQPWRSGLGVFDRLLPRLAKQSTGAKVTKRVVVRVRHQNELYGRLHAASTLIAVRWHVSCKYRNFGSAHEHETPATWRGQHIQRM
jgi:hypothetical protein